MNATKLSLIDSREKFFGFVKKCNGDYRIVSPSFYLYKKLIEKHRTLKDFSKLLNDSEFIELVYITLIAWNMNQRGAKLVPFNEFKKSVFDNQDILMKLYGHQLTSLTEAKIQVILTYIENLFSNLKIMKSNSKIVGLSKTLHFLIPDLIMPVDRTYTMSFFFGHNAYSQDIVKEFKTLKEIFIKFYEIAKELSLSENDLDNFNWNTSVPKLIDNALIGLRNS